MEAFTLPTGYLFVDDYSKGKLETLSIGDYGKHYNVKADFLGYTRELNGVPNVACMPLQEKWVITVSTQYGCPMQCNFCDVPNIDFRGNATSNDLEDQLYKAIRLFPDVRYTERLNLHFARMGDPIFNDSVFDFSVWLATGKRHIQQDTGLRIETLHPVLTTSLPRKFSRLKSQIFRWCEIKNHHFRGQAGLQFSINSTDEQQRSKMYGDQQLHLEDLAMIGKELPEPISRKYCLNFAYSTDYVIDAEKVRDLFSPDKFMCKITPIHNNTACRENGIKTLGGYDSYRPYAKPEADLKAAGFDVLVFVPSLDEEDGLVTCGNAILGGSKLKTDSSVVNIVGQKHAQHAQGTTRLPHGSDNDAGN